MRPLYEITNDYLTLMHEIEQCEELSDDQIAQLDKINDDSEQKVINLSAVIKNFEAESEAIEKAIETMKKRKQSVDNKIIKLRDYVTNNMLLLKLKQVKSPYFDITLRRNPFSVHIYNEADLPDKYKKEMTLRKADKSMILDELKKNILIPGVTLEQKNRLDIR